MDPNGLTPCTCGNERRMNERLCEACLLALSETIIGPTEPYKDVVALPALRRPAPERRHAKVEVLRSSGCQVTTWKESGWSGPALRLSSRAWEAAAKPAAIPTWP